jgi:hypothetical protein
MTWDQLTPADDATLHWRQPGILSTEFVLVAAGDRRFARIVADPLHARRARAESATGAWRFEQVGFWTPSIVVRDGTADVEVARLDVRSAWTMNAADLSGADGAIATWEMTSFLQGIVVWHDGHGAPLVTFRRGTDEGGMASWFRTQCRVDLSAAGFAHPQRDLLLCLGWYLGGSVTEPAI